MKYPLSVFAELDYAGSIILNNRDYTSLEIGNGWVGTLNFVDENGDDLDEPEQIELNDVMKEASWFFQLLFEEIEEFIEA